MLDTILGALLPMVVTFLLGFVAAWRRDFGPKEASVLNRMVLVYAVPLALFSGTVTASRAELSRDIPLVVALCVAIIGLFGLVFVLCRFGFRLQMGASALAALTASAPAVPFVGPTVLGDLFGPLSGIPIAIASLVIQLTVVPVTILLLSLDATARNPESLSASRSSVLATKIRETIKAPIVWAPLLAFVIVLSGFHISSLFVHSLFMLGQASGGVALFATGIVLASGKIRVNWRILVLVFLKNIAQPGLVLVSLRWLGYGNPIVREAVLTTAIPTIVIVAMLALQYQVRETEAPSAVFVSVVGSVVTMGMFIALTQ
jgi:malonate transporter and related proteins